MEFASQVEMRTIGSRMQCKFTGPKASSSQASFILIDFSNLWSHSGPRKRYHHGDSLPYRACSPKEQTSGENLESWTGHVNAAKNRGVGIQGSHSPGEAWEPYKRLPHWPGLLLRNLN